VIGKAARVLTQNQAHVQGTWESISLCLLLAWTQVVACLDASYPTVAHQGIGDYCVGAIIWFRARTEMVARGMGRTGTSQLDFKEIADGGLRGNQFGSDR
jgi:hypothetical protein